MAGAGPYPPLPPRDRSAYRSLCGEPAQRFRSPLRRRCGIGAAMAHEPENLVLELLRGMREEMRDMREGVRELRGDIREMRVVLDKHGMQLDYLDEHLEMLRESTMAA